jgi:hypothetical protein
MLADQLTLFKPGGGGRLCSIQHCVPPSPELKKSYLQLCYHSRIWYSERLSNRFFLGWIPRILGILYLKVSKSWKQIMTLWILPKNKQNALMIITILSVFRSFFGRIDDALICFWDLVTIKYFFDMQVSA